jgi:hypothetical protein
MSLMDKTICKNPDRVAQQAETYRSWQSLPPGDRLAAVSELSESAYSFKGARYDGPRTERTLIRFKREPR